MNLIELKDILQRAFSEDIGMGDLSSDLIFSTTDSSKGRFLAKADGVICGLALLELAYNELGSGVNIELHAKDGDWVSKSTVIATVHGPTRILLTAERVILNLLQHMSGIASATREVINKLDDPSISIADTRKTLPSLRSVQKYAVRCGGGKNHRFRLDDGVMIKDNHIKAAGSITKAIDQVRLQLGHMVKIEVETENKQQVLEAVNAKADVIMLDNRSPEEVKELCSLIPSPIVVEVSGGITPASISTYKNCGAHVISLGWLTHSVKAMDISFNLITD